MTIIRAKVHVNTRDKEREWEGKQERENHFVRGEKKIIENGEICEEVKIFIKKQFLRM